MLSLSAFGEDGEAAFGEGDLRTFLGDFLGETDFFFAVTAFGEASFLTTVFFVGDFAALDEALAILFSFDARRRKEEIKRVKNLAFILLTFTFIIYLFYFYI